jgi:hypothetical protein
MEDYQTIDECDGCVKEMFTDKWVDFIRNISFF